MFTYIHLEYVIFLLLVRIYNPFFTAAIFTLLPKAFSAFALTPVFRSFLIAFAKIWEFQMQLSSANFRFIHYHVMRALVCQPKSQRYIEWSFKHPCSQPVGRSGAEKDVYNILSSISRCFVSENFIGYINYKLPETGSSSIF